MDSSPSKEEQLDLDTSLLLVFITLLSCSISIGYYLSTSLCLLMSKDELNIWMMKHRIKILAVTVISALLNASAIGFISDDEDRVTNTIFLVLIAIDSIFHIYYTFRLKIDRGVFRLYFLSFLVTFGFQIAFFALHFYFEIFFYLFVLVSRFILLFKAYPTIFVLLNSH